MTDFREELLINDVIEKEEIEKEILLFIDKKPKPSIFDINLFLSGWDKDMEDVCDIVSSLCQEGIIYKCYGYYELTDYGNDFVKKLKETLNEIRSNIQINNRGSKHP